MTRARTKEERERESDEVGRQFRVGLRIGD